MALNDISFLDEDVFGIRGSKKYQVDASATIIYPGDPVSKTLGSAFVIVTANNHPADTTAEIVGIAASTSTNTASVAGTVQVTPVSSNDMLLIAPDVAATFFGSSGVSQSTYDALVGDRVYLKLSSGTYTILASDSQHYGCVIQDLDITRHPGKVAFSFRESTLYLA